MPSVEEQAFIRRIQANPDEDGPRLIFADWLDEQGDSRGEFIRLQCALASLSFDDPLYSELKAREQHLRDQHEPEWKAPIRRLVTDCQFHRGLIEAISIEARSFIELGDELFQLAPIRRVRFLEIGKDFAELVQSPLLSKIRELDLCGSYLGNGVPNMLSRSPYLSQIEMLDLAFNDLTDRGIQTLAEMPSLGRVRRLHLNDNNSLGELGMGALANSPYLEELRHLDISGNEINDFAIQAFLKGKFLTKLEKWIVHSNRIGDRGVAALVHSPLLSQLLTFSPTLDLRKNEIGPMGAQSLAESPLMDRVEFLDLSGNGIGEVGIEALGNSPYFINLRALNVQSNRITDTGVFALGQLASMPALEQLDLTGNLVSESSVKALQEAVTLGNWRKQLDVRMDGISLIRTAPRRMPYSSLE
jgi:uncharacterized protein (TIGR02996 family)